MSYVPTTSEQLIIVKNNDSILAVKIIDSKKKKKKKFDYSILFHVDVLSQYRCLMLRYEQLLIHCTNFMFNARKILQVFFFFLLLLPFFLMVQLSVVMAKLVAIYVCILNAHG